MSEDNSYRVNLQQLDDAITAMATFGTEVDAHLSEVDALVAALHLDWSSLAAEAQRAAHDKWMTGVDRSRFGGHRPEVARIAREFEVGIDAA